MRLPARTAAVESWVSPSGQIETVVFGELSSDARATQLLLERLLFTRTHAPGGRMERVSAALAYVDGGQFHLGTGIGRASAVATCARRFLLDDMIRSLEGRGPVG
jgi:hypothetical protein